MFLKGLKVWEVNVTQRFGQVAGRIISQCVPNFMLQGLWALLGVQGSALWKMRSYPSAGNKSVTNMLSGDCWWLNLALLLLLMSR
jgi:hypothetical protein